MQPRASIVAGARFKTIGALADSEDMRCSQVRKGLAAAGFGVALMALSAGCGGKNGDEQGQSQRFVAADKSFGLDYSDPPWRITESAHRSFRMQVDSEIFGFELGESVPPMHMLSAAPVRLDQHIRDLVDPELLSEILKEAGVDEDKIPTNFDTIDTNALASLSSLDTSNLSSGLGGSLTGSTSTAPAPSQEPQARAPELPEYLDGVDLRNIRDVAVAELNFLVRENDAKIVDGLAYYKTKQGVSGVSYQLTMKPAVFVRVLYLPTKAYSLRVAVLSLFELSNADIERLFLSVSTDIAPLDPVQNKGE